MRNIIDLHCDTLTECYKQGVGLINRSLVFSLDRLPETFRLCQAMAVFMPDELRGAAAVRYFDNVYMLFKKQLHIHRERITQVCDTATIKSAIEQKQFAAILTVEGGSVLAGALSRVKTLYDHGVRMMTLTWNAENEICGGANTKLGFTPFGRAVVGEMERLCMAVDVSHLSDAGFWELCEFAKKPFAASHSNARAICAHRRNLTDEMFCEIKTRGGVVGLNYCKSFIREDSASGSIDDLLWHVHHFLALGGEDTLALGSDFDGTDLPDYIDSLHKLEFLIESLSKSGVPDSVIDKILFQNSNRYFVKIAGGIRP